jgi:cytoskeletal protein CcmA (bactofilin family)
MISSKPATPTTGKPETSQTATRKLVVGRGIVFSGEITACDCLVVEGTVKANIAGCHDIDIGRLLVRATGRIAAEVRYHQIEIERGGEISGHIQAQAAGTAAGTQTTPTPLPRRA